jgi:hypothetical protein
MEGNVMIDFRKICCEDGGWMEIAQVLRLGLVAGFDYQSLFKNRKDSYLCAVSDGLHQILFQSVRTS